MASKRFKTSDPTHEELRIVMVGKTGVGKSETGNTILGRECFESKFSPVSLTAECSKGVSNIDKQAVAVIDTPGLFDTKVNQEKTKKDIAQCISFSSPGPHVFLVVIRLGRFTEEEKSTVQMIQKMFGLDADKYSMVLFTHGDLLRGTTIEEFMKDSPDLQEIVRRCNGQYHVFNNMSQDRSQVTELLQKIRDIVQKNGGSHYTNEMFQEAERAIEEEKQRILKEKEMEKQKKKEELEKRLRAEYDAQIHKMEMKIREMEVRWECAQQAEEDRRQSEREIRELERECRRNLEARVNRMEERYERDARNRAENNSSVLEDIGNAICSPFKALERHSRLVGNKANFHN